MNIDRAKYFFHYTSREAAFEHILVRNELRFSPYSTMRDPTENKLPIMTGAWFEPDGLPRSHPDHPEKAWLSLNQGAQSVWATAKLLSLTVDAPSDPESRNNLSRGWARARMWEQYAEAHAGVCLLFDRVELAERIESSLEDGFGSKAIHGPVKYVSELSDRTPKPNFGELAGKVDDAYISKFVDANHEGLFFSKTTDWETEHEYRFVVTVPGDEFLFVDFGDALKGIIVSERFPDWQRAAAIEVCKTLGVSGFVVDWTMSTPMTATLRSPGESEIADSPPPAAGE